jgi:hypothetical protein
MCQLACSVSVCACLPSDQNCKGLPSLVIDLVHCLQCAVCRHSLQELA